MIGRTYLDPGDRLSGRRTPAEPVTVLQRWGPGGGPRNVLIEREDGSREVVPIPRRLRRAP
jgi:acetyl esterase